LNSKAKYADTAAVAAEGHCVLVDTMSKFSRLLHVARLPYYGELFVS